LCPSGTTGRDEWSKCPPLPFTPIDAHAKWYYVARQVDGATPHPVQKVTFDGLLHFVAKQQRLAREAFTCYYLPEADAA